MDRGRRGRLALGRLLAVAGIVFLLGAGLPETASTEATSTKLGSVEVVQTDARLSQYMKRLPDRSLSYTKVKGRVIDVKDHIQYQRFMAIGGAMTDSSAWLMWDKLSGSARSKVFKDLFGSGGIGLGFVRVPMGASDFTVHGQPYSYDDQPPGKTDPHLKHFSIAHDRAYILPALRQALSENSHIWLLANPWSPPAWMKANDLMSNRHGTGVLLHSSYGPLAHYFVDFLKAYGKAHVPISAVTPQNEPDNWTMYPGLELSSGQEADFTRYYLRPTMRKAGIGTHIYGTDASWDRTGWTSEEVAGSGGLGGIAWHCYKDSPGIMNGYHHAFPDLDEIVDECSPEIRPFSTSEFLISSLREWATTVAVWNLALNPHGGPVEPPNSGCNGCDGVVTVDPSTHRVTHTLKYYQLGQVGHFVQPGAHRISSEHFVTYSDSPSIISPGLDDVAFRNPDGSEVLIAFNGSKSSIHFGVESDSRWFSYTIPPQATTTFVWR